MPDVIDRGRVSVAMLTDETGFVVWLGTDSRVRGSHFQITDEGLTTGHVITINLATAPEV